MPRRVSAFWDSSGPGLEPYTSFKSTGHGSYSHFLLHSTLERALGLRQLRRLMDDPSPRPTFAFARNPCRHGRRSPPFRLRNRPSLSSRPLCAPFPFVSAALP